MNRFFFPGSRFLGSVLTAVVCGAVCLAAMGANTPPAPAPAATPISGYQVPVDPANIAPTDVLPAKIPEVVGQPKNLTTHPSLLWDQEDIDHYKEMLKTNKELRFQFDVMKAKVDRRIAQGIVVPAPEKGPDGQYPYIGTVLPPYPGAPSTDDAAATFHRWITADSDIVAEVATVYVLTGDEKYGEFVKKLILAWAHCYEWGPCKVQYRSGLGPINSNFVEGLIMHHWAQAYDLVYNLKSWTPEERRQVYADFFYPMADEMLYPSSCDQDKENAGGNFTTQVNNRGLHALASIYAMGVATDDPLLTNAALYGTHSALTEGDRMDRSQWTVFPPRQDWVAATPDDPGHGLLNCFFAQKAIPGGMWIEGTPTYGFYALGSMVTAAEIGWHHGVDFYRNNNGIFKSLFDFPILLGYPDLTTPGLNDSHRISLLADTVPVLYEYAYRRYRDPKYLAMINVPQEKRFLAALADPAMEAKMKDALINPPAPLPPGAPKPPPVPESEKPPKGVRSLAAQSIKFGGNPPSFLFDLDPNEGATVKPAPSVNYDLVGFGIVRTPPAGGKYPQGVILSYGPSASHGHPDKLAIDLFAQDDVLMPSPGVNFPYANNFRIEKWYHTTLSHNALTVDEKSQDYLGPNPKTRARAEQTVFAPASTAGMERAGTWSVYPDVTLDRALFMTSRYLADVHGAFSPSPHKYDFAWHVRGEATGEGEFKPLSFEPTVNGYNWFTSARSAEPTDKAVTITSTQPGKVTRLHLAGGAPTQMIVGEGGIYVDDLSDDPGKKPTCPTLIERRDNVASTVYGNALDFSNDKEGFVKDVALEGGLDAGYALLRVATRSGTDLCFAAYRPGNYASDGLQTDAVQAFAQMNGKEPEMLYLAGGKSFKVGDASIARSAPGLAYVEKTPEGNYLVGNPSSTEATVTVVLPALRGLDAFAVDASGAKGTPVANVTPSDAGVTLQMPARSVVGFFKK